MGFKAPRKLIKIDFAKGHDLYGMHITLESMTLREYNDMMARGQIRGDIGEVQKANAEMEEILAAKIQEWNLEDAQGNPIPPGIEALQDLDRSYFGQILQSYQMAMLGIGPNLGKDSLNGRQSQEESLDLGNL